MKTSAQFGQIIPYIFYKRGFVRFWEVKLVHISVASDCTFPPQPSWPGDIHDFCPWVYICLHINKWLQREPNDGGCVFHSGTNTVTCSCMVWKPFLLLCVYVKFISEGVYNWYGKQMQDTQWPYWYFMPC